MVFDTEMSIPKDAQDKIVKVLQQDVSDIWNQLKAIAEAAGSTVQGAGVSSWHNLNDHSTSVSLGVNDVLLGLGPDRPEAPPGDAPPKVILDVPTWTSGTFHVSAPQADALVGKRLADGPLSLTEITSPPPIWT